MTQVNTEKNGKSIRQLNNIWEAHDFSLKHGLEINSSGIPVRQLIRDIMPFNEIQTRDCYIGGDQDPYYYDSFRRGRDSGWQDWCKDLVEKVEVLQANLGKEVFIEEGYLFREIFHHSDKKEPEIVRYSDEDILKKFNTQVNFEYSSIDLNALPRRPWKTCRPRTIENIREARLFAEDNNLEMPSSENRKFPVECCFRRMTFATGYEGPYYYYLSDEELFEEYKAIITFNYREVLADYYSEDRKIIIDTGITGKSEFRRLSGFERKVADKPLQNENIRKQVFLSEDDYSKFLLHSRIRGDEHEY